MTLVRAHSERLSLGTLGNTSDHVEGGRAYLPGDFGAAHIASDDEAFGLPGQAGSLPNVPREAEVPASEVFYIGHSRYVNVCDCKAFYERQVLVLHDYFPPRAASLPQRRVEQFQCGLTIPACDERVSSRDYSTAMVNERSAA